MKQIATENAKSAHLLSPGIISNGLIFLSGQVHANADLTLVQGSVKDKVDCIMQRIATILHAADASLDDIVKVVIYVTDMAIMPELNKVYPTYFTKTLPVREAVCVSALPLGAQIEFSVVAEQQ